MRKMYKEMPKQYIGLITDHSLSMQGIKQLAMEDYNSNITSIKEETQSHELDTIIYTVLCGTDGGHTRGVTRAVVNSTVSLLKPITEYAIQGMTPLYDSVGEIIDLMERVPDADSPNVSFLIICITDGQENASHLWTANSLKSKIAKLQQSDRWTFTFRVPPGYSQRLQHALGLPAGNMYEWDITAEGMKKSQSVTRAAVQNFYTTRASGATSTTSFYTNLTNVSPSTMARKLDDITSAIQVFSITPKYHDYGIRDFIVSRRKGSFKTGIGYYELMKREMIQNYKNIVIEDLTNKKFYGGQQARNMLGLPDVNTNVNPGDHGHFKIFVQSTSTNRKLKKDTQLVVWRQ